jgi:hypothetical protein
MIVLYTNRGRKSKTNLETADRLKVETFVEGFYKRGPMRPEMSGFGKLYKSGNYKAHLAYDLVAIWEHDKTTNIVYILYVGKREGAPYDLLK